MDISDIVTTEYRTVDVDDTVSRLDGIFEDPAVRAVIAMDGEEYEGVVTQRQLATGHVVPDAKVRQYVWYVARVEPTSDVRSVAGRMVGSQSRVLPVFDDDELVGVVTAEDLLKEVTPFLHVLSVRDVATQDLATVEPTDSIGKALNVFRRDGISHLPVVSGTSLAGVVSLHDALNFAVRDMERSSGGEPGSFIDDASGGGKGATGGFGERSGDIDRMLDLPVENVMTDVPETTSGDASLDDAVAKMLERNISSLVVTDGGEPTGIVTWTDVLEVLTLTGEERLPVQIVNIDLLDDISRQGVTTMIEDVAAKYGQMRVLEANVYLHEHDETLRGVPLIMGRIRLFTDRGHFVGTGEGYGAAHALRLAANVLEREILQGKDYGRSKKHLEPDVRSKLYSWWLDSI